jgi:hypothetical protein
MIRSCPIYVRTWFQQIDSNLSEELERTALSIIKTADLIANKEEIPLLVNSTLLMAKAAFYRNEPQ